MIQLERNDRNLGRRALRGAFFLAGARLIVRCLSLVSIVVLARLLEPIDFGVAALAFVALGLIRVFSDVRVTDGLLALDNLEHAHLDTAFTMQLIRGCVTALLLLAFAPHIASVLGSPELTAPLRVLSLILVLDGIANPAYFLYQRNIDFSREFLRDTVSAVFATSTVIAIAATYHSYWALIAGSVVQCVFQSYLTYFRIPYRPSLTLKHWRAFIGFGAWLTLTGMLGQLTQSAPRILIGSLLSPAVLGIYVVGRDLSSLATKELLKPLRRTLFPSFGAIKADAARLRRAILSASSVLMAVSLPIGCGLALLAEELIVILFGAKWLDAAPVLEVLAPVSALMLGFSAASSLLMALRRVKAMFVRALLVSAVTWPAIYIGIRIDGLEGAALAVAVATLFELVMNVLVLRQFAGVPVLGLLGAAWRPLVSVAAMAAALLLAGRSTDMTRDSLDMIVATAPHALLGAVVYAVTHALLWLASGRPNDIESYVLAFGRGALRRNRARRRTEKTAKG